MLRLIMVVRSQPDWRAFLSGSKRLGCAHLPAAAARCHALMAAVSAPNAWSLAPTSLDACYVIEIERAAPFRSDV
jgi:hypothetical protein